MWHWYIVRTNSLFSYSMIRKLATYMLIMMAAWGSFPKNSMWERDGDVSPKPVNARTLYLICNGEDFQFLSELPVMCAMSPHLSQHKFDQKYCNIIITTKFWKCLLFHSKLLAFSLSPCKQKIQDICILCTSIFVKLYVFMGTHMLVYLCPHLCLYTMCVCSHMYLCMSLHVCTITDWWSTVFLILLLVTSKWNRNFKTWEYPTEVFKCPISSTLNQPASQNHFSFLNIISVFPIHFPFFLP
jgi:hypothetical protein